MGRTADRVAVITSRLNIRDPVASPRPAFFSVRWAGTLLSPAGVHCPSFGQAGATEHARQGMSPGGSGDMSDMTRPAAGCVRRRYPPPTLPVRTPIRVGGSYRTRSAARVRQRRQRVAPTRHMPGHRPVGDGPDPDPDRPYTGTDLLPSGAKIGCITPGRDPLDFTLTAYPPPSGMTGGGFLD
jgi:hypothetical protein